MYKSNNVKVYFMYVYEINNICRIQFRKKFEK
jgi:hypothetical protein